MQVHASPQAAFVNLEEPSEPRAEEADHVAITVREPHCSVALRPFAGVQRDPGREERAVAQRADAFDTFSVQRGDLGELGLVERMGTALWAGSALRRGE